MDDCPPCSCPDVPGPICYRSARPTLEEKDRWLSTRSVGNSVDTLKADIKAILSRHEGRDRAITGRELAQLLGFKDDRVIRATICEVIRDGLPVLSATEPPAGYFVASSRAEWQAYDAQLKSRIVNDALRKRDVKIAVGKWFAPAVQEK